MSSEYEYDKSIKVGDWVKLKDDLKKKLKDNEFDSYYFRPFKVIKILQDRLYCIFPYFLVKSYYGEYTTEISANNFVKVKEEDLLKEVVIEEI